MIDHPKTRTCHVAIRPNFPLTREAIEALARESIASAAFPTHRRIAASRIFSLHTITALCAAGVPPARATQIVSTLGHEAARPLTEMLRAGLTIDQIADAITESREHR